MKNIKRNKIKKHSKKRLKNHALGQETPNDLSYNAKGSFTTNLLMLDLISHAQKDQFFSFFSTIAGEAF